MGMLEPGGELDLAEKASGAQHGGEAGVEDLQGDETVVFEISGQVDRGHTAAAELPLEEVAVAEGFLEHGVAFGHGIALDGGTIRIWPAQGRIASQRRCSGGGSDRSRQAEL